MAYDSYDGELDALNDGLDMVVALAQINSESIDVNEFKIKVLKRYSRIQSEHISQLEDRVYRLETVFGVMCHSLGINLEVPLNAGHRPCNHSMGSRISVLDTHLDGWRSVLEAPRVDGKHVSETEES